MVAESLQQRIQCCEDELAIRNLIARYGFAVDCGDTRAAVACHTLDAQYIVSSPRSGRAGHADSTVEADLVLHGRDAIADMLDSDLHQSLLPDCAHTISSLMVSVSGDKAEALGYSQLFLREDSRFKVMRVAVNRWQLGRYDGKWLIDCRESRLVGESAAQSLLKTQMARM